MNYYTIAPLHELLKRTEVKAITSAIIAGLQIELVKKQRQRGQKKSPAVYKNYMLLLARLRKELKQAGEMSPAALRVWIDRQLRIENLPYHARRHSSAHQNCFDPPGPAGKIYDIALYNLYARRGEHNHHAEERVYTLEHLKQQLKESFEHELNQPAATWESAAAAATVRLDDWLERLKTHYGCVCYARFEEFPDRTLIGNMQIDSKKDNWEKSAKGELLGQTSNVYRVLVQETIKHALTLGAKKIIFQAGYAAEIAQWGNSRDFIEREKITEKNIKKHHQRYKALTRQYEKINIGDIVLTNWGFKKRVVKKQAQGVHVRAVPACDLLPVVYNLPYYNGFRPGLTFAQISKELVLSYNTGMLVEAEALGQDPEYHWAAGDFDPRQLNYSCLLQNINSAEAWKKKPNETRLLHQAHLEHYRQLVLTVIDKNAEAMLAALNKIFHYVGEAAWEENPREKVSYLREWLKDKNNLKVKEVVKWPTEDPPLFSRLQDFLLKFEYDKKIMALVPAIKKLGSPGVLCHEKYHLDYYRLLPPPPEIDQLAWPNTVDAAAEFMQLPNRDGIYDWYENILPKIFKKLNITYRRAELKTAKPVKAPIAYGWEITTSIEELKQRPLVLF